MYKKIFLLIIIALLFTSCHGSNNKKAKSYRNDKCLVYYPNNQQIKEYAISLCQDGQKDKIDYLVKDQGDFKLITYENGLSFFTENDFSEVKLNVVDNLDILTNEIRYQMKKSDLDIAYTSNFIIETEPDNLDPDKIKVIIDNDNLGFYFEEYDYTVKIPIEIGQSIVKRDFGYQQIEYVKKRYVNPNRPMIALTFDDGPYKTVDSILYDLMEKYDSRCTFFFVGSRFTENELEFCKKGIAMGFEYASHTWNHENLSELDKNEAKDLIYEVIDDFDEQLGYKMKMYRPPYGFRNREMEEIIDIPAIIWNVDSKDWDRHESDYTYQNVMDNITANDVVLLHSLYESTGQACIKLIPDLIDEGYQLVTVSELMQFLNITDKVFGGK